MARRSFDVIDVTEILVHWHAGRSKNQMAASLGVDRKTLRKYIAAAEAAGITPGGPPRTAEESAELVGRWFPQLADTRLRQVTWPAIGEHHEFIREQLQAGVTVSTIHQRLRDEHGLAVSVASLRRYVAANVPEEVRRSQVRVLNPYPAEAGEQAQMDYGQLGRWLDPATGRLRTVHGFVMVLACSRHMFVRPVLRMDQASWTECHVKALPGCKEAAGEPSALGSDTGGNDGQSDRADVHVDRAGVRARLQRVRDKLGLELIRRVDAQASGRGQDSWLARRGLRQEATGRLAEVACVAYLQLRTGGRPAGEHDLGRVARVVPARRAAELAAAEADRGHPGRAVQRARVAGQVGELKVVVSTPGVVVAGWHIQPHHKVRCGTPRNEGLGVLRRGGGERGRRPQHCGARQSSHGGEPTGEGGKQAHGVLLSLLMPGPNAPPKTAWPPGRCGEAFPRSAKHWSHCSVRTSLPHIYATTSHLRGAVTWGPQPEPPAWLTRAHLPRYGSHAQGCAS
jgi:transposase